jgi:hypothetical protein
VFTEPAAISSLDPPLVVLGSNDELGPAGG